MEGTLMTRKRPSKKPAKGDKQSPQEQSQGQPLQATLSATPSVTPIEPGMGEGYSTQARSLQKARLPVAWMALPSIDRASVEDDDSWIFSGPFLDTVRACVSAGITPEQVGAITMLMVTANRLVSQFKEDPKNLEHRVGYLARTMLEDRRIEEADMEKQSFPSSRRK